LGLNYSILKEIKLKIALGALFVVSGEAARQDFYLDSRLSTTQLARFSAGHEPELVMSE